MNNLSWLLYLAELSGSVLAISVISTFGFFIATVVCAFTYSTEYGEDKENLGKLGKKLATGAVIFALISTLAPSKHTIYLIIASEYGEKVMNSEQGKKAIEGVMNYLENNGKKKEG